MLNLGRVVALGVMVLFLFSLTVISVCAESGADLSFDAEPVHWWFGCFDCHLGELGTFQGACFECHNPDIEETGNLQTPTKGHRCIVCHGKQKRTGKKREFHEKHTQRKLDCGLCHADAILQDDRQPMPDLDNGRRQLVERSGMGQCRFCHRHKAGKTHRHMAGKKDGRQKVHKNHAAGRWQWCCNCHEGTDERPPGLAPPVTQPSETCEMCHDDKRYNDVFPFKIHKRHAGRNKCYSCHQVMPQLFDWPELWLSSPAVEYGINSGSAGAFRGAGHRISPALLVVADND